MKKILTSYVYYCNWQYNRKGYLFQDHYMSEPAKNDVYFLAVLRYVYLNPLKAGLPDDITSYLWSSYLEYISKLKIVNIAFALNLFNTDRDKAIKEFKKFHALPNNGKCLDIVKNLV